MVLALGVPDFVGIAVHRGAVLGGEPDRGAQVIDVGVSQQDRAYVAGAVAQRAQRRQHVVAVAGIAGIDQHDTGLVGDQHPVDRGSLGEMDLVGDLDELRALVGHARECRTGAAGRD